jgi:dihydrofolate reductase
MIKISIIVALDENNLIGKRDGLPWRLPADLKHFQSLTTNHTVIMGRKTYDSIGRALPDRLNIVITKATKLTIPGCLVVKSPDEALNASPENSEVFIIGGAEIYRQFLPLAQTIHMTRIHNKFEGDIYFPSADFSEWETIEQKDFDADEKNPYKYSFLILKRKTRN